MKIMELLRRVIGKSAREDTAEEMLTLAKKSASEARRLADKKIEDIYAQLNGCGDKWFLTPHNTIDECKEDSK